MRKPKRDAPPPAPPDECRTFIRACATVVFVFALWGVLYMPLRPRAPLPPHLAFMSRQREVAGLVRPDNDTSVVVPRAACGGGVFVAVVVCSAVGNVEQRNAIRSTWAQDALRLPQSVRVFFLLGVSPNSSLNSLAESEAEKHGDILQEDFTDSYNNLTVKSVMMLKWVTRHCPQAKYVMKTDDDMFVHLPNLFRLLKTKGHANLLLGCLIKGATPVKDWNSKWYVPDAIFPGRVYPTYLSGTGYVLSRDTVPILYRTALATPFFYLEDIFITGICAARAGLKPVNNDGFKFYKRKTDVCLFRSIVTAHRMSPKELKQVWASLKNPSLKCKT